LTNVFPSVIIEAEAEGGIKMLINLVEEKELLESEINRLEMQKNPIEEELRIKRERLSHINALINDNGGNVQAPTPRRGIWTELCNQYGWQIGGDSAHRVVRRQNPDLHSSIPHNCPYDGRTYT
jgi:hypothetical protein